MTPRRNVLVFHAGALGDFILTWPLALALGRVFPQSRIIYVTAGEKGALAERVLRVESADVEGGWHQLFSASPELPAPALRVLTGAHRIFTFVGEPGSVWSRNVAMLAPEAEVIFLSQKPPGGFAGHVAELLVAQLAPWPAWAEAVRQLLRSVEGRGAGSVALGKTAVLHPGSGSPAKNWPADRFLGLGRRLVAEGRAVRFVLGEVEAERWDAEATASFAAVGEVRRPATLLELLACCAGAGCFVGNDSGPGHLAAIVGVPTVSLFGPTNAAQWRPLGPRVRVISGTPMEEISVDAVYQAIIEAG